MGGSQSCTIQGGGRWNKHLGPCLIYNSNVTPPRGPGRLQSGSVSWSVPNLQDWVRKINRSHERLRGAASCPGLPRPSVRRKPGCVSSEEGRLRPAETSAEATFSGRKWILLSLQQRPDSGWKKSRALCQALLTERGVWLMEPFAATSEPRSVWRMPVCLSKGWTV